MRASPLHHTDRCTFGRRLRKERIPPKLRSHNAAHVQGCLIFSASPSHNFLIF